ncbi:MAG: DUF308 domain-containing protein [Bacteroidota bacterium]
MSNVLSEVSGKIKNWWVLSIIGVLMVVGAIQMFRTPVESFAGITVFFSMLILVAGVLSAFYAFTNREDLDNWGLYLAGGILDIIIGIVLLKHPAKAVLIFSVFIGFWLLFRGILTISASFKMKKDGVDNWGWILIFGALTTIFAFMAILYKPLLGGAYLSYVLAFSFFLLGMAFIFISLQLKKVKGRVGDIKEELGRE